ncbi:MAG: exodeoxyribonuclease V subunit gamma [Nitrospirae bacterium]|nr:exodeoxyribonuclease V subunit gamma [Nitrospirota bacterium]
MKTLFIARPGARRRRDNIFKEIISFCPGNDFSSVFYICPNSFIISEAERDFHNYLKRPAYIPFQTSTLKQFAERIFGGNTISERIRPLIIAEILSEKNAGYTRLLSDLLRKLKHYMPGQELSEIRAQTVSLIFEEKAANRAADAIESLIMYEDWIKKRGLSDSEEVLKMSIPIIKETKDMPIVVIDGFFDPTPLELEMIMTLIEKAENAFLLADSSSGICQSLSDYKGFSVIKLDSKFHRASSPYSSYPSIEEEVESIAKTSKAMLLEGTSPWDIVVSFPDIRKYAPIVKRVFAKHGIPLSIEEQYLSCAGPVIALESLLTCIEEDYPSYDFLALLTSPSFPEIHPLIKEWSVAYSYRAGVIKGKGSWLSIKETLLNSVTEKVTEEESARIEHIQNEIRDIIGLIENVKRKGTLPGFLDTLEDALKRLGFSGDPAHTEITDMIEAQFDELRQFHKICGETPNFESRPVSLLRNLLRDMKAFSKRGGGVRLIPFELAAGIESEALFFGGTVEEDLPSRPVIDPMLPERVKKELGLPYLEYYISRQKRYFNMILHSCRREPYISCPSAEGDNLLLPSPFLDWDSVRPFSAPNIFSEEEIHIMEGLSGNHRGSLGVSSGQNLDSGSYFKGYISVTDIDSYRRCPRRFYIEKVLNITAEEPPKFEVEARLWGSLAHKTMEHLFRDGEIDIDGMDKRLFEGLTLALKRFPVGDFWSKVAHDIFRRLLPELKAREKDIRADGFTPFQVEKKVAAEIGILKLKGKIDRIDKKKSEVRSQKSEVKQQRTTDNGQRDSVILIDYKTGRPDKDSLQLPLYVSMWQKENPDIVERAGIYSLRDGSITWYPSKGEITAFTEDAIIKAEEIAGNIRRGVFPPEPHNAQECRYCYHSPLCEGAK